MAAPIGPGDWVECITVDANAPVHPSGNGYSVGELCIVSDVGLFPSGRPWLNCQGKITPADCGLKALGWRASAFRPIYRPNREFIEALKAPPKHAPIRETEPA